jgi:ketopantoate reductase
MQELPEYQANITTSDLLLDVHDLRITLSHRLLSIVLVARTRAHFPQDLERGRKLEVDALLTAPISMAKALGVQTPLLEALRALLLMRQATAPPLHSETAERRH